MQKCKALLFVCLSFSCSLLPAAPQGISYSRLGAIGSLGTASSVASDSQGNTYAAGWAAGTETGHGTDAFVARWNAAGTLDYLRYFGGSGEDRATALAVDPAGNAYIAGFTTSPDLPVRSAWQAARRGSQDAFLAKFAADGSVVFATYLGGSGISLARGIAVDGAGNVYAAGSTNATDFPVSGAYQSRQAGQFDAFVVKLSAEGDRLLYSTFLGGGGSDYANAVAVDAAGAAYVAGATGSADFPTRRPLQAALRGGEDAFVAKLSADGASLVYSTYLGGSGGSAGAPEAAAGIAVDGAGNAYVAGATSSADFPGRRDGSSAPAAFLVRLNASGDALVYSSALGGGGATTAAAVALAEDGTAVIAGSTAARDLPLREAAQPAYGGVSVSDRISGGLMGHFGAARSILD